MKSHPTVAQQRAKYRGFTLLELLIVIVIIGILAALTLGAFRFAQESAARNRTIGAHGAIRGALEQYKEKWGEYPEPAQPDEEDAFVGQTYKIGGAHMLYQAITGDGSSAIRLSGTGDTSESDGNVTEEERLNSLNASGLPKSVIYPNNVPAGTVRPRLLVDGWNRPFQYIKAAPSPEPPAPPVEKTTINPTYDLWSFGPVTTGAVPTAELEDRRDSNATASWIKNW